MSGHDIPVAGLLAAFGVTGSLAWLGAGRRRGGVAIGAALVAVQGVLHLIFSAAGEPHGAAAAVPAAALDHATPLGSADTGAAMPAAPVIDMPGMAGMHHGAAGMHHGAAADLAAMPGMDAVPGMGAIPGMDAVPGMDAMSGMGAMAGHGGLGMIAAHVLAALFCAIWLARGEAAVFRLARALGSLAVVAAAPLRRALALVGAHRPHTPARPVRPRTPEPPRALRGAAHAHDAVRRGPPGWPTTRATAPGRPACA
ncbi:hypothetical protein ACIBEA_35710 [Streptomyces sp. NPDC051555]|uniref:hypothetical protein n=1 Tax=Streptomyces sp. NPDC051555 TaxID=3365657 RepID=UPI0037A36691